MKILIDGPISGTYSLSIVNREFALALLSLGQDVYLTQREGPDPLRDEYFLNEEALVGRYVAYSEAVNRRYDVHSKNDWPVFPRPKLAPLLVSHCYAWEESTFPVDIAVRLEQFDGIFTTSEFTSTALRASGYTGYLRCIGNGVDHLRRSDERSPGLDKSGFKKFSKDFRFLHVSSGLLRKGMDLGIKAFVEEFKADDDVKLVIKTHYNDKNVIYGILNDLDAADRAKIELVDEDLSHHEMRDLILASDFCFFPSRGEGFLLPAAEAMLLGVPVCVTACGGNRAFCTEANALIIPTTLQQAKSHVTLGKSTWLEASQADIQSKLRQARLLSHNHRRRMIEAATATIERFTWEKSAQAFIDQIGVLRGQIAGPVESGSRKITILSTYNQRCGIATYTEKLAGSMIESGMDVTILSETISPEDATGPDDGSVCRAWNRGNDFTDSVLRFLKRRTDLDTLLIQHHPGIVAWDQLASLVKQLAPFTRSLVVELHSTAGEQIQIGRFVAAMRTAGSIIVHNSSDYIKVVSGSARADNVLLLPHPVDFVPERKVAAAGRGIEIFSFGICLPHKQFEAIIKAVYYLKLHGHQVKAKIITSIPANQGPSIEYAHDLYVYLRLLDLEREISITYEFLSLDDIMAIASSCTVAVFPYAEVKEGASGAARVGLTANLPVVISPSTIFEDLDGVCDRIDMNDVPALAQRIVELNDDPRQQLDRQEAYIGFSSWQKHLSRLGILMGDA